MAKLGLESGVGSLPGDATESSRARDFDTGERARWVEISHKLESNPLDESVNKDGESALNRLSSAHDVHVAVIQPSCSSFCSAGHSDPSLIRKTSPDTCFNR